MTDSKLQALVAAAAAAQTPADLQAVGEAAKAFTQQAISDAMPANGKIDFPPKQPPTPSEISDHVLSTVLEDLAEQLSD